MGKIGTLAAATATALTVFCASPDARAEGRAYVTLRDDGTLAGKISDPYTVMEAVMKTYKAANQTIPDVVSLWTAFPTNKSDVETLYLPCGNDVTGIGLENEYGKGDEVFSSEHGELRSILLHNNVLALAKRAQVQATPLEGFAEYLFLLELSHNWGPSARVPEAGGPKDELIGFPFHWSFWMDAGGSPAGGNTWKDNGNGTFTVSGQQPSAVTFSMLDLYLMGLADPSEVPAFGVLQNAVPPAEVIDPFTKGKLSKQSFPWFGDKPVTVTATRRQLTIDDVIATNGPRKPARASAKKSWTLGVVLMVGQNATDDTVTQAEAAMDTVAPKLAPAFERATRGRGTMRIVTKPAATTNPTTEPTPQEPEQPGTPPSSTTTEDGGGCTTTPSTPVSSVGAFAIALATLLAARRRRSA